MIKASILLILLLIGVLGCLLRPSHAYTEKRPDNFVLSPETPISIGHGIVDNLSTSTEPVDILSYGIHFRIPRNYLDTITENRYDRAVIFTLYTLFPDFAGVQSGAEGGKLTEENKKWRWKFSPNLIMIYSTYNPFSPEHDPETLVFNSEAHRPEIPGPYGLLKATARFDPLDDDYFQRPKGSKPGYMVGCEKDPNSLQTCDVYMRVSKDVIIQYRFHRQLLPHWREINQKVSQLIQSFIVKD